MAANKSITMVEAGIAHGVFRPEAFEFLREGLDYTVLRMHGRKAGTVRKILRWLESQQSSVDELPELVARGNVPGYVEAFIDQMGGVAEATAEMNLHVDGEQLCHGLRDLAQDRWGLMASSVLAHWGIRSTRDIGRMVFTLVEQGLLAKQPEDDLRDFDDVYDFQSVFDRGFAIDLNREANEEPDDQDDESDDE